MMERRHFLAVAGLAVSLLSQTGVAAGQGAAAKTPPATELPSLDDLTATRDRPLFSSTRRPSAAPEEPAAGPAPIAEAKSFPFELVGIVLGPDIRIAIFRKGDAVPNDGSQPATEEMRRKVGEKLGEWAVDEIAERFVVLQGDAKRIRLRIFNAKDTGIQVGRPGDAAPAGDGDPAGKEPTDPADGGKSGQVDEEIAPAGTPRVVVPAPRTVVRQPARPGPPRPLNVRRPQNPQRPPNVSR